MFDPQLFTVCACKAACQSYAQSLATDCSQFLVLVQSDASLQGTSDAQLEAAIESSKPSPA